MARPRKNVVDENALKMTQAAHNELVKELEHRQNTLRKEIADEISAARDLGDLSENHAYAVAMEKKDLNENRISEIEDILKTSKIVETNSSDSLVSVGETVEIMDIDTKRTKVVTLIGSEETKAANPIEGKISTDSPIGKAINNAMIGDTVSVVLPGRTASYKVVKFIKKAA